jgi:hypothetical protein
MGDRPVLLISVTQADAGFWFPQFEWTGHHLSGNQRVKSTFSLQKTAKNRPVTAF